MADTVFEYALRDYRGGLYSHPAPESHGIFALHTEGHWELRFPSEQVQGNLVVLPLSVIPAGQYGCRVTIRYDQDSNVRTEFDLP